MVDILNQSAVTLEQANHLHCHAAAQLLMRLEPVVIRPKRILDLGCGTGCNTMLLQQRFPDAHIIGIDISEKRVALAQEKYPDIEFKVVSAAHLPFAAQEFDLVWSNALLHWCDNLSAVLREIHRILTIGGLFAFSYYGPDTFAQLGITKGCFYDMHIVGDALVQEKFNDPILDIERCTVDYDHQDDIIADLNATGEIQLVSITAENINELHYELVYGHAWKAHEPMSRKLDENSSMISLDMLRRSLPGK